MTIPFNLQEKNIFGENDFFDPYVTFDPKLVLSKVRVCRLVIVTKYDHN